ncbi:SDR family oxidoreductase [Streptomyces pseudogriseolus]|uniref:SDR family oxidoreductase n=1 Tax=Streptomyces pseudogriseolus TaxID=36817 RepID=UPI003FA256FE
MARPEETAAAVVFLASGQNSFVTGSSLCVDGGLNPIRPPADRLPFACPRSVVLGVPRLGGLPH